MEQERVEYPAIKVEVIYEAPRPNRHSDIWCDINAHIGCNYNGSCEGFITNTGRFVSRSEAMQIARAAGQVISDTELHELYTEDLY